MLGNKKILLLGTGGHCSSVLDSIIQLSDYDEIGLVDKEEASLGFPGKAVATIMGIPMIGTDHDLIRLHSEGYTDAFISVGSIRDVSLRRKLYQLIKQIGFHIPNIIDKNSVVSTNVSLGEGIYIGKNAVVNAFAKLGNCTIINTSCVIEHQCTLGDFVHIAPGSILCGNVQIEAQTHIGAGSVIKQGIHIGANTMIGMGSIVLKDIASNTTAYGNPCKEVEYE